VRLLTVVNSEAARVEAALSEIAAWFEENCEAAYVTTTSQDELKNTLLRDGPAADRIVIGGGDGTISNALPELLKLNKPLAVLPLGTANDFARSLGLPQGGLAAARVALHGRAHQVDVGLVNGRPFLNVASVGVAAEISQAQSKELKRTWGILSYPIGLLRVARDARPFHVELVLDGVPTWSGAVYQASVGNGRYHGGGLTVAEHAAIDDGTLHVYVVLPGTFWQLLACVTHLKFGFTKPGVLRRQSARHVSLRTWRPRSVNADGEIVTKTPAEFLLLPKRLTVMVPQRLPVDHRGLVGKNSLSRFSEWSRMSCAYERRGTPHHPQHCQAASTAEANLTRSEATSVLGNAGNSVAFKT
jgi:diacylglycerol kinase (ATP)